MYEDDPQDTVFDVLGVSVFGDHPLGRPIIGRAPVIRDTPVDAIAAFHARRYVPSSVVVAAAGSVDHDQVVELAERTLGGAAGGGDRAGARARAAAAAGTAALPAQGHGAGARLPRRPRAAARRRAALRRPRARRGVRRAVLLAAVPGGAGGARARLLGLLLLGPVHRHGPDRPLRRHAARTTCRGDAGRGLGARPAARGSRVPGRARAGARERQGARRARAGVLVRADEPARRLHAVRPAAAGDGRADGARRRRVDGRPARARRTSCGRPSGSRRRASGPRRRPSARPSSPSARARRRWRLERAPRRRRRAPRGAWAAPSARRSRRRRTSSSAGVRIRCSARPWRTCSTAATSSWTSRGRTPCRPTRAPRSARAGTW